MHSTGLLTFTVHTFADSSPPPITGVQQAPESATAAAPAADTQKTTVAARRSGTAVPQKRPALRPPECITANYNVAKLDSEHASNNVFDVDDPRHQIDYSAINYLLDFEPDAIVDMLRAMVALDAAYAKKCTNMFASVNISNEHFLGANVQASSTHIHFLLHHINTKYTKRDVCILSVTVPALFEAVAKDMAADADAVDDYMLQSRLQLNYHDYETGAYQQCTVFNEKSTYDLVMLPYCWQDRVAHWSLVYFRRDAENRNHWRVKHFDTACGVNNKGVALFAERLQGVLARIDPTVSVEVPTDHWRDVPLQTDATSCGYRMAMLALLCMYNFRDEATLFDLISDSSRTCNKACAIYVGAALNNLLLDYAPRYMAMRRCANLLDFERPQQREDQDDVGGDVEVINPAKKQKVV